MHLKPTVQSTALWVLLSEIFARESRYVIGHSENLHDYSGLESSAGTDIKVDVAQSDLIRYTEISRENKRVELILTMLQKPELGSKRIFRKVPLEMGTTQVLLLM